MKISVLTPTYNRAELLGMLYKSLIKNKDYGLDIEWLIMDDVSNDNTKEVIKDFEKENKIQIKYYYQENQGKMVGINNLITKSEGELIVICDSDDFFTDNAFKIIKETFEKNPNNNKKYYAMCFLKYDTNGNNMGKLFKNSETTMFDLYFKEGEDGEKSLVYYSDIRKKYKHELEEKERFITEARMYHKMDEKYKILCINEPIMICEYQEEGYTKNIIKQFKANPYGYYKYFQEILQKNMKGVIFKKRLYAIKHYILFSVLTKNKKNVKKIRDISNKLIYSVLYIPGVIKTKLLFNHKI